MIERGQDDIRARSRVDDVQRIKKTVIVAISEKIEGIIADLAEDFLLIFRRIRPDVPFHQSAKLFRGLRGKDCQGHSLGRDLVGQEDAGATPHTDDGHAVTPGAGLGREDREGVHQDFGVFGEFIDQIEPRLPTAGLEGHDIPRQGGRMGQGRGRPAPDTPFDDQDWFFAGDFLANFHELESFGEAFDVNADDFDTGVLTHVGQDLGHPYAAGIAAGNPFSKTLVVGLEHFHGLDTHSPALGDKADSTGCRDRGRSMFGKKQGVQSGEIVNNTHAVRADIDDVMFFADLYETIFQVMSAAFGKTVAEYDGTFAPKLAEFVKGLHGGFGIDGKDRCVGDLGQVFQVRITGQPLDRFDTRVDRVDPVYSHAVLEYDTPRGPGSGRSDNGNRLRIKQGIEAF